MILATSMVVSVVTSIAVPVRRLLSLMFSCSCSYGDHDEDPELQTHVRAFMGTTMKTLNPKPERRKGHTLKLPGGFLLFWHLHDGCRFVAAEHAHCHPHGRLWAGGALLPFRVQGFAGYRV